MYICTQWIYIIICVYIKIRRLKDHSEKAINKTGVTIIAYPNGRKLVEAIALTSLLLLVPILSKTSL